MLTPAPATPKTVGIPLPWGSGYGLARSLMALASALTLLFSDTATLFRPVSGLGTFPTCGGGASAGLFCLVHHSSLTATRLACAVTLLIVASGWRPRWTAVPHAYIAYSVASGISLPDGGDQVAAILSLLLLPLALSDDRSWHWSRTSPTKTAESRHLAARALLGCASLTVIKLQVAGIYFQSSTAKFSHQEWADGTAMWYWFHSTTFGLPHWLANVASPILGHAVLIVAMTWGALLVELAIVAGVLMRQRLRWFVLGAGLLLHLSIAMSMGLWSFSLTMWGALILLLTPVGWSLPTRQALLSEVAAARAKGMRRSPARVEAKSLQDERTSDVVIS